MLTKSNLHPVLSEDNNVVTPLPCAAFTGIAPDVPHRNLSPPPVITFDAPAKEGGEIKKYKLTPQKRKKETHWEPRLFV
jgi:hypothetical protein